MQRKSNFFLFMINIDSNSTTTAKFCAPELHMSRIFPFNQNAENTHTHTHTHTHARLPAREGTGGTAAILVRDGTLKVALRVSAAYPSASAGGQVGDVWVSGHVMGKVRSIADEFGKVISEH
jgi:hypothetical protein